MKGQYLAVETVFVFGLGLMAAIGVITLFNQFKIGVLEDAEPQQAEIVSSKIENAMRGLSSVDGSDEDSTGYYRVDLPERIAGSDYSINMRNRKVILDVGSESYTRSVEGLNQYTLTGSASGGDVTVFKQRNQLGVRAR